MKIGLSFGRCVKDIVNKVVDEKDVLVIMTQTDFDITNSNSWDDIYLHYTLDYDGWAGISNDVAFSVVEGLWFSGKIHQPRKFNSSYVDWHASRRHHWLETITDTTVKMSLSEKTAWDYYKFVSGLSS